MTSRTTDVGALINAGGGGPALFVVSDTTQAARLRQRSAELRAEHQDRHQGADRGAGVSRQARFAATVEASAQAVDMASGTTRMLLVVDNARRRADDRRVRQRAARAAEPGSRDPRAGERADLRPEAACASPPSVPTIASCSSRSRSRAISAAKSRSAPASRPRTASSRARRTASRTGDQVRIAGKPGPATRRRPRRSGSGSFSIGFTRMVPLGHGPLRSSPRRRGMSTRTPLMPQTVRAFCPRVGPHPLAAPLLAAHGSPLRGASHHRVRYTASAMPSRPGSAAPSHTPSTMRMPCTPAK